MHAELGTQASERLLRPLPGLRHACQVGLRLLNARVRLRGVTSLGRHVQLQGRCRVQNLGGTILIGDRVTFDASAADTQLVVHPQANLEIGERTFINYGCSLTAAASIRIGRRCLLGTGCTVIDSDFHGIEDREHPSPPQPVVLEDRVWLGTRTTVLKGVTIGHDSVVGAGSVVTRSVPPCSVAAGNPARILRRFGAQHVDSTMFDRCNLREIDLSEVQAHGGGGRIRFARIAGREQLAGACNFIDLAILPPGASIGLHRHARSEEELYLVLQGTGRMRRNGESFPVRMGELVRNPPGGAHALENTGDEDLHLFVFELEARE